MLGLGRIVSWNASRYLTVICVCEAARFHIPKPQILNLGEFLPRFCNSRPDATNFAPWCRVMPSSRVRCRLPSELADWLAARNQSKSLAGRWGYHQMCDNDDWLARCLLRQIASAIGCTGELRRRGDVEGRVALPCRQHRVFRTSIITSANWMLFLGQDSLSDGRKIFRLFKEFREVYKVWSWPWCFCWDICSANVRCAVDGVVSVRERKKMGDLA